MQDSHVTYLTVAYVVTALLLIGEILLLRLQSKRVRQKQEQE